MWMLSCRSLQDDSIFSLLDRASASATSESPSPTCINVSTLPPVSTDNLALQQNLHPFDNPINQNTLGIRKEESNLLLLLFPKWPIQETINFTTFLASRVFLSLIQSAFGFGIFRLIGTGLLGCVVRCIQLGRRSFSIWVTWLWNFCRVWRGWRRLFEDDDGV